MSAMTGNKYDRIYCGGDCPTESLPYIKDMLKLYGIAIVPCDSQVYADIEHVMFTRKSRFTPYVEFGRDVLMCPCDLL